MGFCIIWINLNHFPIPFDRFLCIIDLFESNAKVEVRIYIIGVNFNGCAISFDCFFKFPHIKKRNSKIVVSTTVAWVNSDGCAEALDCIFISFCFMMAGGFNKILFCCFLFYFFRKIFFSWQFLSSLQTHFIFYKGTRIFFFVLNLKSLSV